MILVDIFLGWTILPRWYPTSEKLEAIGNSDCEHEFYSKVAVAMVAISGGEKLFWWYLLMGSVTLLFGQISYTS